MSPARTQPSNVARASGAGHLLVLALLVAAISCSPENAAPRTPESQPSSVAPFHVGIITGPGIGAEDGREATSALLATLGASESGGYIHHLDLSGAQSQDWAARLGEAVTLLAADPLARAIIVCPAPAGTARVFEEARTSGLTLPLLAALTEDDALALEASATMIVDVDNARRGYTLAWTLRELGVTTLVGIRSAGRKGAGTINDAPALLKSAMKAAADFGLEVVDLEVQASPASQTATARQRFVLETVPALVARHGAATAFMADDHTGSDALVKRTLQEGGFVPGTTYPSPRVLATAIGLPVPTYPALLKSVEQALIEKGGTGRYGTWPYGAAYAMTTGLAGYAIRNENSALTMDPAALAGFFDSAMPGTRWVLRHRVDPETGVQSGNHLLLFTDVYLPGKGYVPTTKVELPAGYRSMD